jgi:uncharacterized protein with PIN domain
VKSNMQKLAEILGQERRLRSQEREIRGLREEVQKLQEQNARMREGMRRCVTCDYRIEVVARREAEGS